MDFRKFIESLGDALGMRLENAGGACALDVDGVTVMLHDADDLVFLAAEIGPPPPEDGLETLFRTVLKANWLYRGTGGATLAINPEDGCIWLEKYNFLERLDGAKGAKVLGEDDAKDTNVDNIELPDEEDGNQIDLDI